MKLRIRLILFSSLAEINWLTFFYALFGSWITFLLLKWCIIWFSLLINIWIVFWNAVIWFYRHFLPSFQIFRFLVQRLAYFRQFLNFFKPCSREYSFSLIFFFLSNQFSNSSFLLIITFSIIEQVYFRGWRSSYSESCTLVISLMRHFVEVNSGAL